MTFVDFVLGQELKSLTRLTAQATLILLLQWQFPADKGYQLISLKVVNKNGASSLGWSC